MSRPVIGVCAALERARWTVWDTEANVSQRSYSRAIADAGAQAVLLPAEDTIAEAPDEALDLLDALVLAGGGDLDPATYGAPADARTTGISRRRDRFELALARRALERDLPLLGICRGMQVLNVACGGTLVQHLDDAPLHLHTPGQFCDHEVELEPGSLAARAVGGERVRVRSHHHQGIGELGDRARASGWSLPDRVVEAIELPERRFALGILWHAEEESPSGVMGALVATARGREIAA